MNEFIRLDDGHYYRRSAFAVFDLYPEQRQSGGGGFRAIDDENMLALIQEPYEYTPTGRWILRGKLDGHWRQLCNLESYAALRDYAFHEFALDLPEEPLEKPSAKPDADS